MPTTRLNIKRIVAIGLFLAGPLAACTSMDRAPAEDAEAALLEDRSAAHAMKTSTVRTPHSPAPRAAPACPTETAVSASLAVDCLARSASLRLSELHITGGGTTPLVMPAASGCVPLDIAADMVAASGRRIAGRLAPNGSLLQLLVQERNNTQLFDYERTVTAPLTPPNMILAMDWQPRPDGNWNQARLTLELRGLRNEGPIVAGALFGRWDMLVESTAPCRHTANHLIATASCQCSQVQGAFGAPRQATLECAAFKARNKIAERLAGWRQKCRNRIGPTGAVQSICKAALDADLRPGFISASHFDSTSCVGHVEWRMDRPDRRRTAHN